jgi:hypothetical protein
MPQCFFFIEQDERNEEEGTVRALCLECHQNHFPKQGWFYDGQIGPWTVKCYHCGKIIHEQQTE